MKVKLTEKQYRILILKEGEEEKFDSSFDKFIFFLDGAEDSQLNDVAIFIIRTSTDEELEELLTHYQDSNKKIYSALVRNAVIDPIVGDMLGNTNIDPGTNMISHRYDSIPRIPIDGFKKYYNNNPNKYLPTNTIREFMVGAYARFWPLIESTPIQNIVWKEYMDGINKQLRYL
jgi:hypothetical protein